MSVPEEPVFIHLFRQNPVFSYLPAFEIYRSCRTASDKHCFEKTEGNVPVKLLKLSFAYSFTLIYFMYAPNLSEPPPSGGHFDAKLPYLALG
jgi:hypothetical protein